MTPTTAIAAVKAAKLNRVERNAWTKRKIFDAATRVVGKFGYAEASVARITEQAGVAQGTFYNHFENRQELLDQLLPKIGMDMVRFIRDRTGTAGAARSAVSTPTAIPGRVMTAASAATPRTTPEMGAFSTIETSLP